MNKSWLSLAVLSLLAGAASAQSSVTVYGLVDLAVTKGNGGTAPNSGANGTSKAWLMKQSTSSRLGFRGNEDMGGGLSAQFQIEHRFTPDDGGAATPFWAGRSYVQLTSASAGSVYLGREYTPAFHPAVKTDPFGWNGVGQAGQTMWATYASPQNVAGALGISGVRTSNTVGYKSPKFAGLSAQVAMGLGEGVVGRDFGFNVEYGAGPIYAAIGYEKMTGVGSLAASSAANGNSLVNLAFHYTFGPVTPRVYFAQSKVNVGTASPSTDKYFMVGATASVGGGVVKAFYGRLNPQGSNNDSDKVGLGYDHFLSKRTNLYLDGGFARADLKTKNNVFALGVKHTF